LLEFTGDVHDSIQDGARFFELVELSLDEPDLKVILLWMMEMREKRLNQST
jgi:hypothetical protein